MSWLVWSSLSRDATSLPSDSLSRLVCLARVSSATSRFLSDSCLASSGALSTTCLSSLTSTITMFGGGGGGGLFCCSGCCCGGGGGGGVRGDRERALEHRAVARGLDRIADDARGERIAEDALERRWRAHRQLAIAAERGALAEHRGQLDRRAGWELDAAARLVAAHQRRLV